MSTSDQRSDFPVDVWLSQEVPEPIDPIEHIDTIVLPRARSEAASATDTRLLDSVVVRKRASGRQKTVNLQRCADAARERQRAHPADGVATSGIAEEAAYYHEVVRRGRRSKYAIRDVLGAGGVGMVFAATDLDLLRPSALKTLLTQHKTNRDTLSRFVTEAKITSFLEHPSIMPVHDLGFLPDTGLFFSMKLIQGEALNEIIERLASGDQRYRTKYTTFYLLSIFRRVCDAIEFAHANSILHLDIKPHNIMVGDYGEVLLMDWGLARLCPDYRREQDPIKQLFFNDIVEQVAGREYGIEGTPAFMAPEQAAAAAERIDRTTDIFLLGATLYHLFTWLTPYDAPSLAAVLDMARQHDLRSPQARSPGRQIPEAIARIIMKAMAAEPVDRYQTVAELSRDVDDIIAGKWTGETKKWFPGGSYLMQEGETATEAYLIIRGSVRIIKRGTDGGSIELRTCQAGEIIGEMALVSDVPRSASALAERETEVAVLTKPILLEHLRKLPPYIEKIVATLSDRVRGLSGSVNPRMNSDATAPVLKQLRLLLQDRAGGDVTRMVGSLSAITREIASDLALGHEEVARILARAVMARVITLDNDQVRVRNVGRLMAYTNAASSVAPADFPGAD